MQSKVQVLITRLLKDSNKGERLRSRLNLKGFGDWNKPTTEHEGITQDIQQLVNKGKSRTLARKLVAQQYNLKYGTVTKTDQRMRRDIGKSIQDLASAGVPRTEAQAFMGELLGMNPHEIKKLSR